MRFIPTILLAILVSIALITIQHSYQRAVSADNAPILQSRKNKATLDAIYLAWQAGKLYGESMNPAAIESLVGSNSVLARYRPLFPVEEKP